MRETFVPSVAVGDPIAIEPVDSAVRQAGRSRRSARPEEQPRPLTWPQLGALLAAAYAWTDGNWFTVPSAGALYPLVVHVLLRKPLGPLSPGVWWYDAWSGGLRRQLGERPAIEPLLFSHPVTDPLIAVRSRSSRSRPTCAVPCASTGRAGYRFALTETGAVMQTAYLVGAELGIPVRACGGYHDAGLNRLLDHPDDVVCTLVLFAGA